MEGSRNRWDKERQRETCLKEDVGCCCLYMNRCHFSQELRTVRNRVFKKDALQSNVTTWDGY